MKNCAPDGAQFLNVRISSALLVLLQQHGHALGARSAAEDEHRAERLQRLHYSQSGVSRMIADLEQVDALHGRAHISAATRQFLRYLDRRNAPEAPAGCTGFDNQA